jgi:hypothetical protein
VRLSAMEWANDEPLAGGLKLNRDGKTDDCRALRSGHDSRHRRCGCPDLQEQSLGATDGEYRDRSGIYSVLFAFPRAPL